MKTEPSESAMKEAEAKPRSLRESELTTAAEVVEYLLHGGADRLMRVDKSNRDMGGWGVDALERIVGVALDAARRDEQERAARVAEEVANENRRLGWGLSAATALSVAAAIRAGEGVES